VAKYVEIAQEARILALLGPDVSSKLIKAMESLARLDVIDREVLRQPSLKKWQADYHRDVDAWSQECRKLHVRFHELAILCRKELPELRLKWVRIGPTWRMDDKATNWEAIAEELRLIDDEAWSKHFASSPTYLTYDQIKERIGNGYTKRMVQERKVRLGPPDRGDGTNKPAWLETNPKLIAFFDNPYAQD
jgi:hypothetical protein